MKLAVVAAVLAACASRPHDVLLLDTPPPPAPRCAVSPAGLHEDRDTVLKLAACLADPDPAVRDAFAFETLSRWMRASSLDADTLQALRVDLEARLEAVDPDGFENPFAALALSEVARVDRLKPFLTADQRAELLAKALAYFTTVRDYRGFDGHEGWRHGVAHGADLLLQLALNPALGAPELARIRDAVATQITPAGHSYTFGEPDRLARPILAIAGRNVFTEQDWRAWMAPFATGWDDWFRTSNGLARRHDALAFFSILELTARLGSDPTDDVLIAPADEVLKALP